MCTLVTTLAFRYQQCSNSHQAVCEEFGFTLDCYLTMNAHVSNIARTCYFELRSLASIRGFMTSTATATLVSAFFCHKLSTVTIMIIIIMVIFKCYFSREHIALSYEKLYEHRIRKKEQIKSTAHDEKSY